MASHCASISRTQETCSPRDTPRRRTPERAHFRDTDGRPRRHHQRGGTNQPPPTALNRFDRCPPVETNHAHYDGD
jgi:hypothetical protein